MNAKLIARIVVGALCVVLIMVSVWSITSRLIDIQAGDLGRPIDAVIIHTTCDIYDEGGGMVTIYDGDGRIWKANPFELGAMTSLSSPESPE